MQQSDIKPSGNMYAKLARAYALAGRPQEAVDVLRTLMPKAGHVPSIPFVSSVLVYLCTPEHYSHAVAEVERRVRDREPIDAKLVNQLLVAIDHLRLPDSESIVAVRRLLTALRDSNQSADNQTTRALRNWLLLFPDIAEIIPLPPVQPRDGSQTAATDAAEAKSG